MNPKRRPTHPGWIIFEDYMIPLSLTFEDLALDLDISGQTLRRICERDESVDSQLAARLSSRFGTSKELWLNLQDNYDQWSEED